MSDSIVKCLTCGKEEQVKFGFCLFKGWPKCCGYTMRLMKTDADIDNDVFSGIKEYATITLRSLESTQTEEEN